MTGKDRDNVSWLRELVKDANKLLEATVANVRGNFLSEGAAGEARLPLLRDS